MNKNDLYKKLSIKGAILKDSYSNEYERKRPQKITYSLLKREYNYKLLLLRQDLKNEKTQERKLFKKFKVAEKSSYQGKVKEIKSNTTVPIKALKEKIELQKKSSKFSSYIAKQITIYSKNNRKYNAIFRKQIKGINLSSDSVDTKRFKINEIIEKRKEDELETKKKIAYLAELKKYTILSESSSKSIDNDVVKNKLVELRKFKIYNSLKEDYESILENAKLAENALNVEHEKMNSEKFDKIKNIKNASRKFVKEQFEARKERIRIITKQIKDVKKKISNLKSLLQSNEIKADIDELKKKSVKSLSEFRKSRIKLFTSSFKFNFMLLSCKFIYYFNFQNTIDNLKIFEKNKNLFLNILLFLYFHISNIRVYSQIKKLDILSKKYSFFADTLGDKSYEFDYYIKLRDLYKEYLSKLSGEFAHANKIKTKAIKSWLQYLEDKKTKQQDKEEYKKKSSESWKVFKTNLLFVLKRWFKRELKMMALKNRTKVFWNVHRDLKRELRLFNNSKKFRNDVFGSKKKTSFEFKTLRKDIKYKTEFIVKTSPIETINNFKWIILGFDLMLPGFSALIMKQWTKAFWFLALSGFMYGVILPLILGFYSLGGQGLVGLFTLGHGVYFADSRMYIVEGVISVISLTMLLSYWAFNAFTVYKIGVMAEMGIRPNAWFTSRRLFQKHGLPYLISTPAWFFALYISMMPIAATFIFAFTNYGGEINPPATQLDYIGFRNFRILFNPKLQLGNDFMGILWWTVQWTFFTSLITISLGFILAYVTNHDRVKFKWLWRTIQVLPWAIPGFLMILYWRYLIEPPSKVGENDAGLAWKILTELKILSKTFKINGAVTPNAVQRNAVFAKIFLIFLNAWLASAFMSLFYSGILQGIPKNLYEAAKIDGAKTSRQLVHITIPLVLLAIAPIMIRQVLANFNNFGLIWLFTDGGPQPIIPKVSGAGETDIVLSWIYKMVRFPTRIANAVGFASVAIILVSIFTVSVGTLGTLRSKAIRKGDY